MFVNNHWCRIDSINEISLLVVEEVAVDTTLLVKRVVRRKPHPSWVALDGFAAWAFSAAWMAARVVAEEAATASQTWTDCADDAGGLHSLREVL